MDLLLDEVSYAEISRWFSMLWEITYELNPIKKRVSLAYRHLITGNKSEVFSKLTENKRTVSFFFGVFSSPSEYLNKYKRNFDPTLLDSRYYALGALFKNHFFITEIESQLRLARAKKLNIEDDYLEACLELLNDRIYDENFVVLGDPHLFADGLQRIKARMLSASDKRDKLFEVTCFMDQLAKIQKEKDPESRKALVRTLPLMSRFEGEAWNDWGEMVSDEAIASAMAERSVRSQITAIKTENVFETAKTENVFETVKTKNVFEFATPKTGSVNALEMTRTKNRNVKKENVFEHLSATKKEEAGQVNEMQVCVVNDQELELFSSETESSRNDLADRRIPLVDLNSNNSQPISQSSDCVLIN